VKSYDFTFNQNVPSSVWVTNELSSLSLKDVDGTTFTCIAEEQKWAKLSLTTTGAIPAGGQIVVEFPHTTGTLFALDPFPDDTCFA
jgi:hypothetical protein